MEKNVLISVENKNLVLHSKEKGITLIALIFTIVVIMILSVLTFRMILGQNGLLNKTKDSAGGYELAEKKEMNLLESYGNRIADRNKINSKRKIICKSI